MKKARTAFLVTAFCSVLLMAATSSAAVIDPFEIYTVPVGSAPAAVAHSPTTGKVFVGNTGSGTVSVIDELTGEVVNTVPVGPAPHGIAVNPAQGRVYVAIGETNRVAVLNAATGAPIGPQFVIPQCTGATGAWGLSVNPTTNILYVACYSAGYLVAVHGTTGTVLRATPAPGGPLGVAVDPVTNLVYLGMIGQYEMRVYDGATLALVTTIRRDITAGIWGVTIDPVTHRVFAANYLTGTVQVILGTRVIATYGGFRGPEWIAFDSARNRVWVPEFDGGRVTGLDLTTGEILPVAIRGTKPAAVAVNPAGLVYSANFGTLNVSVILQ